MLTLSGASKAPQKEVPPRAAGKAKPLEGTENETEASSSRIFKYDQVKKHSVLIRQHIDANLDSFNGDKKNVLAQAAVKLKGCANFLQFRDYFTIGERRLIKTMTCKQFLICKVCAVRRATLNLYGYFNKFLQAQSETSGLIYSLVTLTVQHGKKDSLLDSFNRLKHAWQIVNGRIKHARRGESGSEFGKFLGWVGTYEVTNNGTNGWHPHLHILVVHKEKISAETIRREWSYLTDGSDQIDVTPGKNPDNPLKDFSEVFKYTLKFSKMSNDNILEAFLTLKGKRLIFNGGLLRGVKIPEDLLDTPLEGLPYVEEFYQYIDGLGYTGKLFKLVQPEDEKYTEIVVPPEEMPFSEYIRSFDPNNPVDKFLMSVEGISFGVKKRYMYFPPLPGVGLFFTHGVRKVMEE